MKSMILCAGLGTRLKPWTLSHPKALVPVGGIPMLLRVAQKLSSQGFNELILNVHHFSDQIIDFVKSGNLEACRVDISDETEELLDTGGGILNAENLLTADGRPFLVHNVDILSNADLIALYDAHVKSGRDITLLVSERESSRKLIFSPDDYELKGWRNESTGETRPAAMNMDADDVALAFSGIYVMSVSVFNAMRQCGFSGKFPIMDFFLAPGSGLKIGAVRQDDLEIIDIGKPETLQRANLSFT